MSVVTEVRGKKEDLVELAESGAITRMNSSGHEEKYGGSSMQMEAQKAIAYAEFAPDISEDVVRHYWYKILRTTDLVDVMDTPNYTCDVYTGATADGELTEYDIVDVTSFNGNRIEAEVVDAVNVNAREIFTTVLDSATVQVDYLEANIENVTRFK